MLLQLSAKLYERKHSLRNQHLTYNIPLHPYRVDVTAACDHRSRHIRKTHSHTTHLNTIEMRMRLSDVGGSANGSTIRARSTTLEAAARAKLRNASGVRARLLARRCRNYGDTLKRYTFVACTCCCGHCCCHTVSASV